MEKDLTRIKYELQELIDKYEIQHIDIEIENKLENKKVVSLNVKI